MKFYEIFIVKIFNFHFLYNFNGKIIECAIDQDWVFCVFVALFWDISWNQWCLSITYFKRETYALQNTIFGSLFESREIIKQKTLKTRFFYFHHFWNFMNFQVKIFSFHFLYNSNRNNNWMCYWSWLSWFHFFNVFASLFWGISLFYQI